MAQIRAIVLLLAFVFAGSPALAQQQPPGTYSSNELVDAGHRFFGTVSRDLALVIEKAFSQWGQPNGYILGQEASGAITVGLRYGEGTLYTRNAGDLRVYWQGPSLGFDLGGDGARTMILVYSLPRVDCDLSAFRRHIGVRLFHRRLRRHRAILGPHGAGADPLRRRPAAGR